MHTLSKRNGGTLTSTNQPGRKNSTLHLSYGLQQHTVINPWLHRSCHMYSNGTESLYISQLTCAVDFGGPTTQPHNTTTNTLHSLNIGHIHTRSRSRTHTYTQPPGAPILSKYLLLSSAESSLQTMLCNVMWQYLLQAPHFETFLQGQGKGRCGFPHSHQTTISLSIFV